MKEQTPLYSYSGEYTYEHGALKQFHASYQSNVACLVLYCWIAGRMLMGVLPDFSLDVFGDIFCFT